MSSTSSTTITTTLDSTGRVVVPSEVRRRLRLAAGARFRLVRRGGRARGPADPHLRGVRTSWRRPNGPTV